MRVWALASCSGLLALAACSAEQSSSPNPSTAPPDGDAAEIKAQPGLTATASSPMARPEVRPRQVIQGSYRLNPAVGAASTTARNNGDIPQAAALRDRLQRLRGQQGARLSSSTPLATAPQPAALARPNLSQPTAAAENPAFNVTQGNTFNTQGITPLPAPSRPTPIAPEANPSPVNTPSFSSAALAPAQSASVARTYPIAPLGHQGYSARPQQQAPVLTVAQAEAETSSATTRLHGGTVASRPADPIPGATTTPQVAVRQNAVPSEPSSPPNAAAISNPAPVNALRTASPAQTAQSVAHQSSGNVALTPTPGPVSQTGTADHQSQVASAAVNPGPAGQSPVLWESVRSGAATGTAVPSGALPESLPLNAAPPQPQLVSPQPTPSAAEVSSTPRVTLAEEAAIAPSQADPADILPNPTAQLEATALRDGAAPVLHHQSQVDPETVHLIPTANTPAKGLPIAYCLSPSGQFLPTAAEAQGSLASLPKFSPSSPNDPSLDLGTLSKDDAAELCMGRPASTPELATTAPAAQD
ncbi:hypothetical protein H6F75_04035 [Nodosilinea sp. FACHB-131]|uniref:hypothetical protein n=1 Tax=Cyanophyceae TaxID=3028117 RepID=UPI001686A8AF|nr:hypothetical protein [Nodosilinea sp. FACHB-131]MBD1872641.1 hypothetical protein [Nodosilinea sp. FACHB-131]